MRASKCAGCAANRVKLFQHDAERGMLDGSDDFQLITQIFRPFAPLVQRCGRGACVIGPGGVPALAVGLTQPLANQPPAFPGRRPGGHPRKRRTQFRGGSRNCSAPAADPVARGASLQLRRESIDGERRLSTPRDAHNPVEGFHQNGTVARRAEVPCGIAQCAVLRAIRALLQRRSQQTQCGARPSCTCALGESAHRSHGPVEGSSALPRSAEAELRARPARHSTSG